LILHAEPKTVPPAMSAHWNDSQPIYWQLKERTVAMILDGTLAEGEALPSVRTVAAEFQLNPITVSKSYQALVDDGLVEKRRGLGMFVCGGARRKLLASERSRFLEEEWPAMLNRIEQLGLDVDDLLQSAKKKED
jgi:GntR family transcriptional regulator